MTGMLPRIYFFLLCVVIPLNKLHIDDIIIVEGRYDKNTVSQIVDAFIIDVSGFAVFNNKILQNYLKKLSENRNIIILTDSDSAGFMIRNKLKSIIPSDKIKNAYIPQIPGKEKRKSKAGKENLLGVEGMPPKVIIDSLVKAGADIGDDKENMYNPVTLSDLYALGLTGRDKSRVKREALLKSLDLPIHISTKELIKYINSIYSREEFFLYYLEEGE